MFALWLVDEHTDRCRLSVGVGHKGQASQSEDICIVFATASSTALVALFNVTHDLQVTCFQRTELEPNFNNIKVNNPPHTVELPWKSGLCSFGVRCKRRSPPLIKPPDPADWPWSPPAGSLLACGFLYQQSRWSKSEHQRESEKDLWKLRECLFNCRTRFVDRLKCRLLHLESVDTLVLDIYPDRVGHQLRGPLPMQNVKYQQSDGWHHGWCYHEVQTASAIETLDKVHTFVKHHLPFGEDLRTSSGEVTSKYGNSSKNNL